MSSVSVLAVIPSGTLSGSGSPADHDGVAEGAG